MGFKSQHCEMEFSTFLTHNFIQNETAFVEMSSVGFTLLLKWKNIFNAVSPEHTVKCQEYLT